MSQHSNFPNNVTPLELVQTPDSNIVRDLNGKEICDVNRYNDMLNLLEMLVVSTCPENSPQARMVFALAISLIPERGIEEARRAYPDAIAELEIRGLLGEVPEDFGMMLPV